MPEPTEGFPEGAARADLGTSEVSLTVDESLYPLEAVYGAAFTFLDRCYVVLDRPEPARLRVSLTGKRPSRDPVALRELLGELGNELLASAWRQQLARDQRPLVEAVTLRAMEGALGGPSLEELGRFEFDDAALEDPLGIAVAWEEKYGKKPEGGPEGGPQGGPEGEPEGEPEGGPQGGAAS
jgi:His-Xaa-Ser system protein HxsD